MPHEIAILERGDKSPGGKLRSLPKALGRSNFSPGLAPDGRRLVYGTALMRPDGRLEEALQVATLEGKVLKEISPGPDFPSPLFPPFSPDGRRLPSPPPTPRGGTRY